MVVRSGSDEVVVADLRHAPHDLSLVDWLAHWRLAGRRLGVVVSVRPCRDLHGLLVAVGLATLEAEPRRGD